MRLQSRVMALTFVYTLCLAGITRVEDQATCLVSIHCLWGWGVCGVCGERGGWGGWKM